MLLLALASLQGFSGEMDRKLSSLLQTKRLNGTFFTDDSVPLNAREVFVGYLLLVTCENSQGKRMTGSWRKFKGDKCSLPKTTAHNAKPRREANSC